MTARERHKLLSGGARRALRTGGTVTVEVPGEATYDLTAFPPRPGFVEVREIVRSRGKKLAPLIGFRTPQTIARYLNPRRRRNYSVRRLKAGQRKRRQHLLKYFKSRGQRVRRTAWNKRSRKSRSRLLKKLRGFEKGRVRDYQRHMGFLPFGGPMRTMHGRRYSTRAIHPYSPDTWRDIAPNRRNPYYQTSQGKIVWQRKPVPRLTRRAR